MHNVFIRNLKGEALYVERFYYINGELVSIVKSVMYY